MWKGCVLLIWLGSLVSLMIALEVPHPVVNVKGREVSIILPGDLEGIESIYFQAELVDKECDNNAYSFANGRPWSAKIELQSTIEPNAKLRIQTVVERKNKIATQFSEYKINDNGMGELLDGPRLTSSTDLLEMAAKCKPAKKNSSATLSECSHRSGFSSGDLLFEDNFKNDQKLTDNWIHEMSAVRFFWAAPAKRRVWPKEKSVAGGQEDRNGSLGSPRPSDPPICTRTSPLNMGELRSELKCPRVIGYFQTFFWCPIWISLMMIFSIIFACTPGAIMFCRTNTSLPSTEVLCSEALWCGTKQEPNRIQLSIL
ncbi:uncharacterized protein Dsimw501_GD14763 [Drosophila simulans]|uniref:Uncharacterized protein n=1 Tax=Drosophila simulans TaxID=7240 RepID=A0A0J9RXW7_DROSI|nr:uncharacterized protein Dsimw501_GD14763 [Drosophila simulans]